MAVKVAINGFGRIGRLAFRLMFGNQDLVAPSLPKNWRSVDCRQQ